MPTIKKSPKKETRKSDSSILQKEQVEKYFQGIGRRKCAVAQVRIYPSLSEQGRKSEPEVLINERPYKNYFPLAELREIVISPLKAVSLEGILKVSVKAQGGGIRGQAEATRLGIARALVSMNQEFRKTLKDLGYLTRDARKVERKKAGLKKARRAPQFAKR
jgi:small subunit ribosomal protein S9